MDRELGMLIAIWLPIVIGVATAIALAFSAGRKKPEARRLTRNEALR